MGLAWQFVKKNGYTLSEALKVAWRNAKLVTAMKTKIVRFIFRKVNGLDTREAFGCLIEGVMPETLPENKKDNATIQIYYDTEVQGWRSFKKANLISVAA